MQPWTLRLIIGLVAALTYLSAGRASAHEGHDHGAPPPPVTATIAPRAEASSDVFELVLVARGDELVIHLDDYRTNAPIEGAAIEIDSPAGLLKATARSQGVYAAPAAFLLKHGAYDLAITVTANGAVEVLPATLRIPEPPPAGVEPTAWERIAQTFARLAAAEGLVTWLLLGAAFAAGAFAARLAWRCGPGADTALAIGASLLAIAAHAPPARADQPRALEARDLAQRMPDGALFIPKPTQHILAIRTEFTQERIHHRSVELPGRIIPSPNASGLVQASVGGRLSPPPGGFKPLGTAVKTGDVLAFVRPPLPLADATAQQQQARELDQQISIVARKVERLRALERIIAKSQLEDAELELKGLHTRRANLDRVQRDPEALVAPVDGVIAAANAVAGQMAEPNAIIFQIIDPAVLWVEALSYEAQATSGAARVVFPDGRSADLEYLGTGFAGRNQAVPIQFAIKGSTVGLRAGQFVTVIASTADERRGIALPREAILRGPNGQSLVYEHTNAERFVAREVRVEPLDGVRVLVVAGIEPGRRVVTQGAELLGQIR